MQFYSSLWPFHLQKMNGFGNFDNFLPTPHLFLSTRVPQHASTVLYYGDTKAHFVPQNRCLHVQYVRTVAVARYLCHKKKMTCTHSWETFERNGIYLTTWNLAEDKRKAHLNKKYTVCDCTST